MVKRENKMIRRRLANAYTSSVISIALVLLLVGAATLLIVNAGSVSRYFKENMKISVLLRQEVTEEEGAAYAEDVKALPFVHSCRFVSREEGTEDLKAMLGEDFLSVFETSPVPISLEVSLKADYVSSDSLAVVLPVLSSSDLVDDVECQQSLVDALNANLARISLILGVFILLMLFISFVLINNTVRISVFARRFTVHTMKLVGATRAFIRKPFLKSSVIQGFVASLVALALLGVLLWLLNRSFPELFAIIELKSIIITAAVMLLAGVAICVVSTYFVVNKLVSMDKDELYF